MQSEATYLEELVSKNRGNGVFLDTNILILYIIGNKDRQWVSNHKRLSAYSVEDYDILLGFLSNFQVIAGCPAVIAEASNLIESGEKHKGLHEDIIRSIIQEEHSPSIDLIGEPALDKYGVTDAFILSKVIGNYLVITDDLKLYGLAASRGDCINFNHLRFQTW